MDELLSVEEIEEKYDSEWILVGQSELDEHYRLVRGRVIWHSKDRDEIYQKLIELHPRDAATLYTGQIPSDTAVIL